MLTLYKAGFMYGKDGSDLSRFRTDLSSYERKSVFNAAKKLGDRGWAEVTDDGVDIKANNQGSTAFGRTGWVSSKSHVDRVIILNKAGLKKAKDMFGDVKTLDDLMHISL